MSEVANIPQLRFPGFTKALRRKSLGDFGYFYYGKSAPKWSVTEDAKTPCVRYGELYSTFGEYISDIKSHTNIPPENLKFSKGGEVLVPRVGEDPLDFAYCSFLPISDVAIGEMISVYNTKESGLFFTYYINSKLKKAFARVVEGGNVSNLYYKYLENINVTIPSLDEQDKIIDFLSAVDNKIEQLSKKQELLGEYKKGLMQQIFSQAIRFKADDGSEFPDWEEKTIDKLPILISDGNYGELYPTSEDFKPSGVPFLRANNIKSLKIDDSDTKYISKEQHFTLTSGHLLTNDILITTRGELGNIALIEEKHNGSNINAQICLLRVTDILKLSYLYLLYVLDHRDSKKQYKAFETGTALKQLPKGNLKKIKVKLPCLEEQTKIANFLSSIDSKTLQVGKQLDESKQFKKALLQQMFV